MGTDQLWDHSINLEALGLAEHDLLALDVPFTEVWQTVKEFPSDKLPGPKTGRFYQCCWGVIKSDLLGGAWSVPKKVDAIAVKGYRPISLIHGFSKLVAKLMENHLALRLQEVVSPNPTLCCFNREPST